MKNPEGQRVMNEDYVHYFNINFFLRELPQIFLVCILGLPKLVFGHFLHSQKITIKLKEYLHGSTYLNHIDILQKLKFIFTKKNAYISIAAIFVILESATSSSADKSSTVSAV